MDRERRRSYKSRVRSPSSKRRNNSRHRNRKEDNISSPYRKRRSQSRIEPHSKKKRDIDKQPKPSCEQIAHMFKTDSRLNPLLLGNLNNIVFEFEAALPKPVFKKKKSVVCTYFLANRCMKGNECEFLHTWDKDRMPVCRFGTNCERRDICPYRHVDQEEVQEECEDYNLGFCKHGPACLKLHIPRLPEELPSPEEILSIVLAKDIEKCQKRELKKSLRKTKLCKKFMQDENACEFDPCSYAHGFHDLSNVSTIERKRVYKNPPHSGHPFVVYDCLPDGSGEGWMSWSEKDKSFVPIKS